MHEFTFFESLSAFLNRKEQECWRLVEQATPLYLIVNALGHKVTLITRLDEYGIEFVYRALPGNHLKTPGSPW